MIRAKTKYNTRYNVPSKGHDEHSFLYTWIIWHDDQKEQLNFVWINEVLIPSVFRFLFTETHHVHGYENGQTDTSQTPVNPVWASESGGVFLCLSWWSHVAESSPSGGPQASNIGHVDADGLLSKRQAYHGPETLDLWDHRGVVVMHDDWNANSSHQLLMTLDLIIFRVF